jgi:hypothetical protein
MHIKLPSNPVTLEFQWNNFPICDDISIHRDRTLPQAFLLLELIWLAIVGPSKVDHQQIKYALITISAFRNITKVQCQRTVPIKMRIALPQS